MTDQSVLMIIARTAAIFIYTYVILRLTGRHQISQITLFDFMIVIALGSAVGDVMVYDEDTVKIGHSMLAIAVVAIVHLLAIKLAERNYSLRLLLYGKPRLLIEHGRILQINLRKEDLTQDQLESLLREQGFDSFKEIKVAYMEPDGKLSIIPLRERHIRVPVRKKRRLNA